MNYEEKYKTLVKGLKGLMREMEEYDREEEPPWYGKNDRTPGWLLDLEVILEETE